MRRQLGGSTRQNVAKDRQWHEDCSAENGDNVKSQPIALSPFGNKKATPGEAWQEAEGTGLFPGPLRKSF